MEIYNTKLRAEVSDKKQLAQALSRADFSFVYAPLQLLSSDTPCKDKIIAVPNVFLADCEDEILGKLTELKAMGYERAMAHTVGHIPLIQKAGMKLHGGMRLNVANSLSAEFFADIGFEDIVLSCELTVKRIRGLRCNIPYGIVAYGRLPLMITRRCPINDGKPCNDGSRCGRFLRDRKGEKILALCSNTVELLNPDTLTLSDKISDFETVDFFVLRYTYEENVIKELECFKQGGKPKGKITNGLYYRGVE